MLLQVFSPLFRVNICLSLKLNKISLWLTCLLTGPTKGQVFLGKGKLIVQGCLYREIHHIPFVALGLGQQPLDIRYSTSFKRSVRLYLRQIPEVVTLIAIYYISIS